MAYLDEGREPLETFPPDKDPEGVAPYSWALNFAEHLGYRDDIRFQVTEFLWDIAKLNFPGKLFTQYVTGDELLSLMQEVSLEEYDAPITDVLEDRFGRPRTETSWALQPLRRAA